VSTFKVEVSKDYTVFSSAHFVSYDGDQIEPLHGHNYRTAVAVEGDLDGNSYVINFTLLKRALRAICDGLDHRLLLPTGNPLIQVTLEGGNCRVRAGAKHYSLPAEDVVQLPIANTTSELLAEWISMELEAQLRAAGAWRPGLQALSVECAESFGQGAICRREVVWRG
jgi:6-pyruvoyltetrahydropterin/6-carboxytetrahydropterin synthase